MIVQDITNWMELHLASKKLSIRHGPDFAAVVATFRNGRLERIHAANLTA